MSNPEGYQPTATEIVDALAREKVLAHFEGLPDDEVVGYTCANQDCPIYRYLKSVFPKADVFVGLVGEVLVGDLWVEVPEYITHLISTIDMVAWDGWHPELDDEVESLHIPVTAAKMKQLLRELAPVAVE